MTRPWCDGRLSSFFRLFVGSPKALQRSRFLHYEIDVWCSQQDQLTWALTRNQTFLVNGLSLAVWLSTWCFHILELNMQVHTHWTSKSLNCFSMCPCISSRVIEPVEERNTLRFSPYHTGHVDHESFHCIEPFCERMLPKHQLLNRTAPWTTQQLQTRTGFKQLSLLRVGLNCQFGNLASDFSNNTASVRGPEKLAYSTLQ